jgi:GMP synthase-like glutamine amidotransferase
LKRYKPSLKRGCHAELDAVLLAASSHCQVQVYAVGDWAFGVQFHSEVTDATVEELLLRSVISQRKD